MIVISPSMRISLQICCGRADKALLRLSQNSLQTLPVRVFSAELASSYSLELSSPNNEYRDAPRLIWSCDSEA